MREIVSAATSKAVRRLDTSDAALNQLYSHARPPAALFASNAAVKLGLLIDPAKLDEARAHLLDGLAWWPSNGMAHLNLGDLERDHGSRARALAHYTAAAALPPVDTRGAAPWVSEWVAEPRQDSVGLASYMCAVLHHQSLTLDAALPYLCRFPALRYRLSSAVWKLAGSGQHANNPPHPDAANPDAVRRFDGCVPPPLHMSFYPIRHVPCPLLVLQQRRQQQRQSPPGAMALAAALCLVPRCSRH